MRQGKVFLPSMDSLLSSELLFSFALSFKVAFFATLLVTVFSLFLGHLLANKKFWGRNILDVLLTLPLVLPPSIVGYYLIILLGRNGVVGSRLESWFSINLMFNWYGAVIAAAVVAFPLMFKSSRAAFESVDRQYIFAARLMGKGRWTTFWTITLPLAKRGIVSGLILSFTRALGEFGATLMIAGNIPGKTNTIPLAIYSLVEVGEWGAAHFIVLVYSLCAAGLLFFANRLSR